MALNIAITSKYNPLTYEDYIKPLEGYWEDYEKQEAAFDQLGTDVATLRPIIANMADGEEKTKYINWLNELEAQANSLQSNGLTTENRKALRGLKASYASLMPRLALAEESRRKAAAEWMAERNSGKYFTEDNLPQELQNVNNFLDGNIPSYSKGISKDEVSKEAMSAAKAFSSKVFNDPTITKDSKAGIDFIKQVEERGYNVDIDDIQNDELLSPILESLYEEYGVDKNATDSRSKSIRDYIAKEFWKGLVYEKQTNYQQYRPTKTDAPYHAIANLADGNKLIRSGNKHLIIDKNNNLIGEWQGNNIDDKPKSYAERKDEEEQQHYREYATPGYDLYNDTNIGKSGKTKAHDESFTKSQDELIQEYISTVIGGSSTPKDRRKTRIVDQSSIHFNSTKAEIAKSGDTEALELFDRSFDPENTIVLGSGGTAGNSSGNITERVFGDNHYTLMDIDVFLAHINSKTSDLHKKLLLLKNAYDAFNKEGRANLTEKVSGEYTKVITALAYSNDVETLKNIQESDIYKDAYALLKDDVKEQITKLLNPPSSNPPGNTNQEEGNTEIKTAKSPMEYN